MDHYLNRKIEIWRKLRFYDGFNFIFKKTNKICMEKVAGEQPTSGNIFHRYPLWKSVKANVWTYSFPLWAYYQKALIWESSLNLKRKVVNLDFKQSTVEWYLASHSFEWTATGASRTDLHLTSIINSNPMEVLKWMSFECFESIFSPYPRLVLLRLQRPNKRNSEISSGIHRRQWPGSILLSFVWLR